MSYMHKVDHMLNRRETLGIRRKGLFSGSIPKYIYNIYIYIYI